jgi:hypothetical protein
VSLVMVDKKVLMIVDCCFPGMTYFGSGQIQMVDKNERLGFLSIKPNSKTNFLKSVNIDG